MKNLLFKTLMVIGLATVVVACSEDEETPAPVPTEIGTWQGVSQIFRSTSGAIVLRNDTLKYPTGFATMEFKAPKSLIINLDGDIDTLDYTYANGKVTTIQFNDNGRNDTMVYNKVNLTLSTFTLTQLDTTDTGGGLLISEYTINLKK